LEKICVEQSKSDIRVRTCCKRIGTARENVDYGREGRNRVGSSKTAVKPVHMVNMLYLLCAAQE